MNCLLPFDLEPECRAYHNKAFELGIIKANLKEYDKWLSQKLINCVGIDDGENQYFEIMEEDIWELHQGLAERQTIYVDPDAFKKGFIDLIGLIQYMLQTRHYVIGFYNEYYIPGKEAYKKCDFWHDYVLFGYDDTTKIFNSAGYLKSHKYESFEIKYSDFLKSVYHIGADNVDLWFYKIKEDYEVEFNIERIVQNMSNYLCSVLKPNESTNKNCYGIAAWDMYAKYVLENQNGFLDLRFNRGFMEHKNIMLNRLKVLEEEGYIQHQELVSNYQREIVIPSNLVHNLCLKYNMTHDPALKIRIYDLVHDINRKEENVLNGVMSLIR